MKNSSTLPFVFLSACFCFSRTIIRKKNEGGKEGWEILFRGYAKEHLSSTVTLSAASDTVPCHKASYFGTFLKLTRRAAPLGWPKELYFCQPRKLKESFRILWFLLKLKSPIYNRDLWWVTSHHLVQHPSQDTPFLWATKREQQGRTEPGRLNQISISFSKSWVIDQIKHSGIS